MSERKPSPFPVLLNNEICSLIQAAEDVYQIRFKNRAANAYLVRGEKRTILIDVGLSSNYPALLECLCHVGCPPESIDMVIALITGYFLLSATLPVPPTSPYIRDAQYWQGEVCWQWLAERRAWS